MSRPLRKTLRKDTTPVDPLEAHEIWTIIFKIFKLYVVLEMRISIQ